jgi:hypothetical protein
MAAAAQRWRLVLFATASAALLLAAVVFSEGSPDLPAGRLPSPPGTAAAPQTRRLLVGLKPDACRFLRAFLSYEVGRVGHQVRATLRATATPAFVDELLRAPPHLRRRPARLERLSISSLSRHPPRALITGSARGAGREEHFAFLFEASHGSWRARGLAE